MIVNNNLEGWKQVTLEEVAEIIRGISFPKAARSLEYRDGDVACLRTTNVQRTVEWENLWFVPEQHVKRKEQIVKLGDILISTANSYELVGKVAPIIDMPRRATLGAFISMLRPKEGLDKKYIYYQMDWSETQSQIRSMASTTTNISNVSVKKLSQLKLVLAPPNNKNKS